MLPFPAFSNKLSLLKESSLVWQGKKKINGISSVKHKKKFAKT